MSEFPEVLSKPTHFIVSSGLTCHRFRAEVNADGGIAPNCIRVGTVGDVVTCMFDAGLSAGEVTTLEGLANVHVADAAFKTPDFVIDPTDDILSRRLEDDTLVRVSMQNQAEVHISADPGVGQFATLAAAVAAFPSAGSIYVVHPGVYVEVNPITIPPFSTLRAKGTAGNTILMPSDLTKDFLIIQPMCKVSKFIISGTETPGQKCLGRGIYFDGGVGLGQYALISESIIKNFDTCIETSGAPTGSHTLLIHRVQVACTTAPLTNGIRAHTQGQIISNSFVASGVPVPLSPVALPFTNAIKAESIGTKMSMNITSVYYCTHAVALDNDGEVEITLLTATGSERAICCGPTGTNSKIRAVNFNMKDTSVYDLEVLAADAVIDLVGAQMDESKIHNPNGVKINATFHGNKNGKKYQAMTGDVRIGTVNEPTNVAIGEGRYNTDTFVVFQNDNLEAGTWTDVTEEARSIEGSAFDMFAGTAAANCLYIGADTIQRGVKLNVITAVVAGDVGPTDAVAEYWDGSAWVEFNFMCNESATPFYFLTTPMVNMAGKYQVRFGLHGATTAAKKTLNGEEKFWCRWRIINAWSSLPELEYIKLHTNSTEINKDGFLEYFGDARPIDKLDWSIVMTEPANSSPDNQDVYMSDKLGVGRVENRFKDNTVDRIGLNEFLPTDIDTSFPIKIKFTVIGDTGTDGDAEFVARWNFTNAGDAIYRTTTAAPTSSTGEQSNSTIITIEEADTSYRGEIQVSLAGTNPNPSNGQPDLVWLTIERDATGGNGNDTYPGNVTVVQMGVYYIKWRDGGHITGY
jgi:hypothetical protein